MSGYVSNIETLTLENNNFREVLFTGDYCQLVVMSLLPGEDIGMEVHHSVDQFFRVESGEGVVIINGEEHPIADGTAVIVPAGAEHNLKNTSNEDPLKLYTIYSPANHLEGTVHTTREEAMLAEEAEHLN